MRSTLLYATMLSPFVALIVSAAVAAGEAPRADAVRVFDCEFGEDWDVNYDDWPDRWVRKTGLDYPHYVQIAIRKDPTAPDKKCLTIDLDGAAAAVFSPPIRVMPRFSYVFEARLKNDGLEHSTVFLTLDFCDSEGRVLQSTRSKPLATTAGWVDVQLDPVAPNNPAIDRVVLGIQTQRAAKGDLAGQVSLADVRLERLPRITITTNNPSNVYAEREGVVVRCELSGIPERDPQIYFQLLDASNRELQSERMPLNGRAIEDDTVDRGDLSSGASQAPAGFEGTAEWRPKIADYGFYRVVVRMLSASPNENAINSQRELASRTIHLAVIPPLAMPKKGEFGWTLPNGDGPLSFQELSRLLPQVGINWVKVPVWFDANDANRGDELIRFVEMLGASNIEVVGIIDRPPVSTELGARVPANMPIAELLSMDTSTWSASLEPVMSRLSLRVRWWQLGREFDTSFVGLTGLSKRINELRVALFRFGQDVRMGLSRNWDATATTDSQKATWDFQQLCSDSSITEKEFDALLARPRENASQRWVLIEPPPRGDDESQLNEAVILARSSELIRRMVAAKVQGADAIIVPNPFSDANGLMSADGMPAELLLPWRTTAAMLGGAEYLGQITLPAGSENRVFLRPDGKVVMVAWSGEPRQEVLYLGKEVRQFDIFGRATTPETQNYQATIHVGPTPTFVLGLHEAITRWRLDVAFQKNQVPSIFAAPHPNSLRFKNFFPQGIGGSLKIVVVEEHKAGEQLGSEVATVKALSYSPDRWTIDPPQGTFQLSPGQEMEFPFDVRLKNALFGTQPIRIDFKVEADEQFEFSVYRDMQVGTEDLTLDVSSHLDKDGTLIVEQLMTNSAPRLADLKCYLWAKGHRPQRMQVYRLGEDVDRKVYRYSGGQELVGKEMLLEIEELNGPRVLKYQFVATAVSKATSEADSSVKNPDGINVEHASSGKPQIEDLGS